METDARLVVAIGLSGEPPREVLLRKYRDLLRLGGLGERRQALWIAPTQAVARDVRERLAIGSAGGLLDPGVTTFAGFAAGVVRDGARPLRLISTLQRRRLVRQVISQAASEGALQYFAPVGGSSGLVNLVDETISRLRRRDVPAKEFARQHRRGSPRLRELAGLYVQYEQWLDQQQLIDAEGMFRAARDRMVAEPAVGSGIQLAVVDGFTDFTKPQLAMLRLLAERAERTVVTLPGEMGSGERRDLFARTIATRSQLVEELGAELQGGASPSREEWPALEHLRRNLFRSYRQLEPVSDAARQSLNRIEIVAASSVRAEIEEIARRVKGLLVGGAAPSDVSVAFRSTFDVADRVRQAFDDFGIPYYLDASRRLNATPLVRSLLNVLRLEVEDWPYRRVLHVVGDRSLGWWDGAKEEGGRGKGAGTASTSARGAVEWLVRQGQLPTGREALLALVGEQATDSISPQATISPPPPGGEVLGEGGRQRELFDDGYQDDAEDDDPFGGELPLSKGSSQPSRLLTELDARGFNSRAAAVRLRGFSELLNGLPRLATIGRWVDAVEKLAASLGLFEERSLNGASPLLSPPVQGEGAGEKKVPDTFSARREWAILAEGLHSAAHVDDWAEIERTKLSLAEFVDLLATTAAELPAPEPRDATGRVQVLSAENMRYLRPRHLFVGGLSELAFPAGRSSGADAESDDAESPSDAPADARSDEMLLFFETVTAPKETLTLSYPALDAKAQPLPASPFLVELVRCFGDAKITEKKQSLSYEHQHGDAPLSRSDVRRHAVLSAHDTSERKSDVKLLAALVRSPRYGEIGRSIVEGIHAVAGRSERKTFGAFEGIFVSDASRSRLAGQYGPDYIWSPSRLETYAACPFRFFGEHLLKLEPLPELALESDLARRGSLLHETLARLYGVINTLNDQGPAPAPEVVARNFQEMLDRVVGERPRRGLDRALVEIERRQIAAWAEQFARQHDEYSAAWPQLDGTLKATYFEARFGPKNRRSESTDDATLSTDDPYQLKIGEEQVRFTGQIDRIDVGQVGGVTVFNVIDYKTSARQKVDDAKMRAGTQLQLPLYAMAVAELLLAEQEAVGLSAGYWSIRGKGFGAGARSGGPLSLSEIEKGVLREAAAWPELKGALIQRIGEIVAGIRQGWFPVFNEDKDCGQYCPLSTGCRIAHVRSLEKRWLPPVGDVP
jgi:ATP-dependent helicase/DNAse subunit B